MWAFPPRHRMPFPSFIYVETRHWLSFSKWIPIYMHSTTNAGVPGRADEGAMGYSSIVPIYPLYHHQYHRYQPQRTRIITIILVVSLRPDLMEPAGKVA